MAKKGRRRRPNKTKHRGWERGCQIRQRERKTTSTTITTTTSPCDSSPSLSLPLSLFLFLFVNSFLFFFLLFWCPSLSLSVCLSIYLLSVLFAFLLTSGFKRITIMGFEPCFVDNVTIIGRLLGPQCPPAVSSFPLPLNPKKKREQSLCFFSSARWKGNIPIRSNFTCAFTSVRFNFYLFSINIYWVYKLIFQFIFINFLMNLRLLAIRKNN